MNQENVDVSGISDIMSGIKNITDTIEKYRIFLFDLADRMLKQNRKLTTYPLYIVVERIKIFVDEEEDYDGIIWQQYDTEIQISNEKFEDILKNFKKKSSDLKDANDDQIAIHLRFRKRFFKIMRKTTSIHLTEEEAKNFILRHSHHNLEDPFVFVISAEDFPELKSIMNFIVQIVDPEATYA